MPGEREPARRQADGGTQHARVLAEIGRWQEEESTLYRRALDAAADPARQCLLAEQMCELKARGRRLEQAAARLAAAGRVIAALQDEAAGGEPADPVPPRRAGGTYPRPSHLRALPALTAQPAELPDVPGGC